MVMMTTGPETVVDAPPLPFRPVTVLEDAKNYTVKHPLQFTWKLWFKDRVPESSPSPSPASAANPLGGDASASNWQNALKSVDDISTVEDFWGWFNVMPKPTDIKHGGDIFLFHQGIEPSWEDSAHAKGSSIAWTLPRLAPGDATQSSAAPSGFVDLWLNAMLACVGCVMPTGWQYVTGVQFSAREKGSRITLWLRISDLETVREVESEFRAALSDGLTSVSASDVHFKFEEFAKQLAYQHSHPQHHGHAGGGRRGGSFAGPRQGSFGGADRRAGTPSGPPASSHAGSGRYFNR